MGLGLGVLSYLVEPVKNSHLNCPSVPMYVVKNIKNIFLNIAYITLHMYAMILSENLENFIKIFLFTE